MASTHEEQTIILNKLQERLASASLVASEDTCLRFLVGWSWDLEKAYPCLEAALKWRAEVKPHLSNCPECINDPKSHNLRCIGFDSLDRPVLYTCFGQAKNRFNADHNVAHLTRVCEDTIALMDARRARKALQNNNNAENNNNNTNDTVPYADRIRDGRWVLVVDYEGFGMSDCSPKTMQLTSQLMQNYPERLALCVQMDAPFIFSAVWRMVLPLLPEVTANKITFLKSSELRSKMGAAFGKELIDWLEDEIRENRDSSSKHKKYWEWLDDDGKPKKHDARGTPSWVSSADYRMPNCTEMHCNSAKIVQQQQQKPT